MGQGSAKEDLENYRNGYPNLIDNPDINQNYHFYSGKIKSTPDGDFIDVIHNKWWGNMKLLEGHHGYVQWLFPIRENGMNYESYPLQLHEIEKIKNDPECMRRYKKSYDMMLHFYGCRLSDSETGTIERHEDYKTHYQNLNSHPHNFLRITRILKSLGEFGFENYKKSFLEHFTNEIWVNGELSNCYDSCHIYWLGTLKDDQQRAQLETKIEECKRNRNLTSTSTTTTTSFSSVHRPPPPTSVFLNPAHTHLKSSSSAHYTESSSSTASPEESMNEDTRAQLKITFFREEDDDIEGDDHGSDDD